MKLTRKERSDNAERVLMEKTTDAGAQRFIVWVCGALMREPTQDLLSIVEEFITNTQKYDLTRDLQSFRNSFTPD